MWRCKNDVGKLDVVTAELLDGAGLRQSAHTGLNIPLNEERTARQEEKRVSQWTELVMPGREKVLKECPDPPA